MDKLIVGLAQMNSTEEVDENLNKVECFFLEASEKNVDFLLFPEVFNFRKTGKFSKLSPEPLDGKSISKVKDFSSRYQKICLAGSFCEKIPGSNKVHNTSVLINKGTIVAVYRKIHLFDSYLEYATVQESKWYKAGDQPQMAKIGNFCLGMSICYDLRFPELYRYYASKGVNVLLIPSSFTKPTGQAHWEVLCRARAIENQCFVLAPNQVGKGAAGIETFGNSLVVDPWGNIIGKGDSGSEKLVTAEIDLVKLAESRRNLPVLEHIRFNWK